MERRKGIMDRLIEEADLPGELLPGQSVVELAGDRRVLIENHRGVTEYGQGKISVRVRYGLVVVCGCGLELSRMTREQLVITGRIDGITLHRGKC
jgi:sporulation protein YqfC